MNTKLLFVSLITLLVIGKSDNDENYDKMMKKKEQLKPFYDALMEPGLGANGGDNDKLDKLMDFMDDEFEYCSRDQIDKGSECKNKNKFRDDMKQKKDDGYYGYKIDIDSIDDDDNYVSVKCQIIFVDEKTGCRTTTKQTDDFYYTKNGKIKLLEAKYEGANKKCPVDSKGNNDNKPSTTKPKHVESPPNKDNIYAEYERMRDEQRNMYKPLTTKSGKEAPRHRFDKEEGSNNKDREDKLKDFYKTMLECGLKKNEDNDFMMDKVMDDYFNDDVDVCSPDGDNMKIENKKCYRGKDAVKNMMQRTFNGKYESIDYTLTIKKKEENYDEVELNGSYKDEDGCIIEVKENDGIHYDSYGKIKILNVKDSVVTSDPEKCGDKKDKSKSTETKKEDSYSKYYVFPEDKKDKPATTEYKDDKKTKTDKPETTEYKYVKEAPQDRFHREDTSNNKPSTTKPKYDQQPPNKDSIYAEYGEMTEERNKNKDKPSTTKEAPRSRFHRKETNDKDKQEEQLNDFYKTMLECALKKTEDIDIMMDKLTDYFSDDIEFCSPDGENMNIENKKCYHGKDAVKSMMKRTFNGKYKSVDYNLLFKTKEERFVEVVVKKSYQDEDGCTIEVKQTDRIYYDSYGKIEVFNVKDSVATRDPEKCSGNKDASKSKEDDYSKKVPPVIPQYKSAKPSTTESERVKEAPQYRFHRETASDSNTDKPSTTKAEYERIGEKKNRDKPSSTEKYVDVNNKDREEKLKDFYKSAVECGSKKNGDADEVIDKLMDEFSDNISLCAPDGGVDGEDMSYKNKKCYHGKEAVRNLLENIIDCKYKVIDHKFKIIENEKSMIRVEIENKYRDEDECVIHFKETIDIYYNDKGEIVIYDVVDSLVYPKKCDFEDVEHLE